jgi:dTMP kinase
MKIISFEGIEGVGKSTQIKLLNEYLGSKGFKTEILREPGSTVTGEMIREILLNSKESLSSESELLLMFAARAQLIHEKVVNSKSDIILFDRFYDASIAYQGAGRGLSIDFIENLIDFSKCPSPLITFLLDISVKEGFARKAEDIKDRIESSGDTFFEKVREGYISLSKQYPERIKLINANNSVEKIHQDILKEIEIVI